MPPPLRYPIYLLYWYKSTNTDAEAGDMLREQTLSPKQAREEEEEEEEEERVRCRRPAEGHVRGV